MTETPDTDDEMLDASADPIPEAVDHPDQPTDEEVAAGEVLYHEVDDLDDDSNGLD